MLTADDVLALADSIVGLKAHLQDLCGRRDAILQARSNAPTDALGLARTLLGLLAKTDIGSQPGRCSRFMATRWASTSSSTVRWSKASPPNVIPSSRSLWVSIWFFGP